MLFYIHLVNAMYTIQTTGTAQGFAQSFASRIVKFDL